MPARATWLVPVYALLRASGFRSFRNLPEHRIAHALDFRASARPCLPSSIRSLLLLLLPHVGAIHGSLRSDLPSLQSAGSTASMHGRASTCPSRWRWELPKQHRGRMPALQRPPTPGQSSAGPSPSQGIRRATHAPETVAPPLGLREAAACRRGGEPADPRHCRRRLLNPRLDFFDSPRHDRLAAASGWTAPDPSRSFAHPSANDRSSADSVIDRP